MMDELQPSIFREVNERIAEITHTWEWDGKQGFLCECAAGRCTQAIWLTRTQYEAIRAEPAQFFVVPGHELAAKERIVARHEDFVVVEEVGEARENARLSADEEPESRDQTG